MSRLWIFYNESLQTKNKCHQNNILIIPTRFKNIRGMFFKEVGNTQREPSDTLTLCTCIVQLLVSLVI